MNGGLALGGDTRPPPPVPGTFPASPLGLGDDPAAQGHGGPGGGWAAPHGPAVGTWSPGPAALGASWPSEPPASGPPARPVEGPGPAARGAATFGQALPPEPPTHGQPALVNVPSDDPILYADRPPSATSRRTLVVAVLSAASLAAVLTAGTILLVDDREVVAGSTVVESPSTAGPNLTLAGEELDIAALLEKAQPSVVTIETNTTTLGGVYGGAGSGVILTEDGLILTNAHVIEGAESITVRLFDGTSKRATLVGSFPDEDVALVQLEEASGLVPAELGSSDALQVGDEVVAIGNALNLGGTPSVTRGIVSALNRSIEDPVIQLDHLIQTDAAINPGNSGGPLLNAAGQVVGINTAIIDDAQNIGFSLAIDALKPLIEDLKNGNGAITSDTPRLGVDTLTVDDVEPEVLEEYGITVEEGAFVSDILEDSPAAEGGLELGDVITAVDGEPITTSEQLGEVIRSHEVGDEVEIEYQRGGDTQTTSVTLRGR